MIYHVVTPINWQKALEQGFYEASSLHTEGFIHACLGQQVHGVIQRYYAHETNLLLLHIDEDKLQPVYIFEIAPSVNEKFPHIYGKINLDAVVDVTSW
jgi:uncharacterized protein (DUF952 family)